MFPHQGKKRLKKREKILGTKGVSFQACSGRTVEWTELFSVTINCVSQGPEAVMPLQLVEGKLQAAVFAALLHAVRALLFVLGQFTHRRFNIAVFMRASSHLQHQGKMVREVPINICSTIHMQIQIQSSIFLPVSLDSQSSQTWTSLLQTKPLPYIHRMW